MTIRVTESKWINGSGYQYTTDIDPIEIDGLADLQDAAQEYASTIAEETQLADNEDLELDFYTPDSDTPAISFWVKETAASATTPAAGCA